MLDVGKEDSCAIDEAVDLMRRSSNLRWEYASKACSWISVLTAVNIDIAG